MEVELICTNTHCNQISTVSNSILTHRALSYLITAALAKKKCKLKKVNKQTNENDKLF